MFSSYNAVYLAGIKNQYLLLIAPLLSILSTIWWIVGVFLFFDCCCQYTLSTQCLKRKSHFYIIYEMYLIGVRFENFQWKDNYRRGHLSMACGTVRCSNHPSRVSKYKLSWTHSRSWANFRRLFLRVKDICHSQPFTDDFLWSPIRSANLYNR